MADTNIGYWEKVLENPTPAFQQLIDAERDFLLEKIPDNSCVLDIGCGDGRNIRTILQKTKNVFGVDNDDIAVASAKETFLDAPTVKVFKSEASSLPFEDGKFDVVILFDILQNLNSQKKKTLEEVKRVTKNEGQIMLCAYSENAFEERMKMYDIIKIPIRKTEGTTVFFDESVGANISEQFSLSDIQNLATNVGLKIIDSKEVGNLARICLLGKIQKVPHMGEGSTTVFSGNSQSPVIQETYGKTAKLFAREIYTRLKKDKVYTLLDIGTSRGELLSGLLSELPEYNFETIGIDVNGEVLADNVAAKQKVVASADNIPLADKSVDVTIARYILQWNYFDRQKKILNEISRVTKSFILVEHSGADDESSTAWREAYARLFSGAEVPKMKRGENFYSSCLELEKVMTEANIKFERVQQKKIDGVSDIFIARYALNAEEARLTKDTLKDFDYFIQTDWVVYPN